jgi:hypothetical protein
MAETVKLVKSWSSVSASSKTSLFLIKNAMKNILLSSFFILLFQQGFSQKVFSVNYANQADVKVYVVKYENQADLKVYKVKYENQAGENNGKWFFTQYENQAKKSIFFVPYENQADLKIFFVDYENQAGWRNAAKKQLLY